MLDKVPLQTIKLVVKLELVVLALVLLAYAWMFYEGSKYH